MDSYDRIVAVDAQTASALYALCGVCVGFVLEDLVFDMGGDRAAALSFYTTVLPGPIVLYLIPLLMAALVLCIGARVYAGLARSRFLLCIILAAAPYFELVTKPAEAQLIALNIDSGGDAVLRAFDAALATITQGHTLLLALLCVSIATLATRPPLSSSDEAAPKQRVA